MAYSSQGSHTGQLYFCSRLTDTTSQSRSYTTVLTRLGAPRSRPIFKIVEVSGIEPSTSWSLLRHAGQSVNEAVSVIQKVETYQNSKNITFIHYKHGPKRAVMSLVVVYDDIRALASLFFHPFNSHCHLPMSCNGESFCGLNI